MIFEGQAACLYGQQIMSKLKGYKLSVKDFRRNMLLKNRSDNSKANKSTPLIQQATTLQNKIKSKNSTETIINQGNLSKNAHSNYFTIRKKYKSNIQYNNQLFIQRENQNNHQINNDRRMNEYISVVLKKAKNDTSKLLRELQKKKQKSEEKRRYNLSQHNNFIKRFKHQIKKIRFQKQKISIQSKSDNKQDPQQDNNNNKNIQHLKNIQQQSLFTKNNKINKNITQNQYLKKILINSYSSSDKQLFYNQKIIKTKRQKSIT